MRDIAVRRELLAKVVKEMTLVDNAIERLRSQVGLGKRDQESVQHEIGAVVDAVDALAAARAQLEIVLPPESDLYFLALGAWNTALELSLQLSWTEQLGNDLFGVIEEQGECFQDTMTDFVAAARLVAAGGPVRPAEALEAAA